MDGNWVVNSGYCKIKIKSIHIEKKISLQECAILAVCDPILYVCFDQKVHF